MNYHLLRSRLLPVVAALLVNLSASAQDALPDLMVSGKDIVDASGKAVVLHGVMDTPNRYFNGWRWQGWKPAYGEEDVQPCLDYFEKIFTALTDHEHIAMCSVCISTPVGQMIPISPPLAMVLRQTSAVSVRSA